MSLSVGDSSQDCAKNKLNCAFQSFVVVFVVCLFICLFASLFSVYCFVCFSFLFMVLAFFFFFSKEISFFRRKYHYTPMARKSCVKFVVVLFVCLFLSFFLFLFA